MLKLCRVSKAFNLMTMEAILESNMLDDVGYWDPIREQTIFYHTVDYDQRSSYPPLLDNVSDDDDTNSEPETPDLDRPLSPSSPEGNQEQSEDDALSEKELFNPSSSVVPSDDFWVMFLKARTLGRIRSKPPTQDHILMLRVAEHIYQYMQQTFPRIELEDMVRIVCEVVVKHGYIYSHPDFYTKNESSAFDATELQLDESCAVFRDALAAMAVYLSDNTLLENTLSNEDPVLCPFHYKPLSTADGLPKVLASFQTPIPQAGRIVDSQLGFMPPKCGTSLMRLANPVKLAVQLGKMECVTLLLKSVSDRELELDVYRRDIITEVALPDQIEFLRIAIESGRPITRYRLVAPSIADMIWMNGRTGPSSRSPAGIQLSKMLETTTNLEVFNLVYDAILEGYNEDEGVWWTKGLSSVADTLATWGLRRLQRAVLDDCLPIVRRLVELGYSVGPTRSIEDLKDEEPDVVADIISGEKIVDVALPIAVKRVNLEVVKLLFFAGAHKKRKNVRKAMRIAMEQGNHGMLEVLASQGSPAGLLKLLNRKAKRRWKKDLEKVGKQDIVKWLEMM
ncbi:altered inheritance of mitochondria 6 [Fusarium pseudocircinatum]|uniref:Altered inheritance of mitochondria 6 n=1 Tax=Fusarium pseudocircinatum TaxID=56676 RepID=A0A8H5L909_9HYPO|nr:altered inheritance of mitochondria 6 [Fusarium pseudocircinatum]